MMGQLLLPPMPVSYAVVGTISDANYQGSASGTLVIAKATASINVTGFSGNYDGNPHGATGTATGVNNEALSGLSLGASFSDVPGGSAHWTFTNANYNDQSGDASIVINKVDAVINVSDYAGAYDGNPHGVFGTATGLGDAAFLTGLSLGDSFTNVPGGSAHWTFTNANYNDKQVMPASLSTKSMQSSRILLTA